MKKKARGFTVLELIVVIACVGILAAFAYPRFTMTETEARKALVTSLLGNVQASSRMAHIQWIVEDQPATIMMEDQTITMLNGYPDEATIDRTLMDYSGFQFNKNPIARFRKLGAPAKNTCMVTYTEAPVGGQPALASYTSGC